MPSAELMAPAPKAAPIPVATDPANGRRVLRGADALPWAIDTLGVVGELRSMVERLQAFIRTTTADEPSPCR